MVNIVSVLIYIFAIMMNRRGNHLWASTIMVGEIMLHQILAINLLGLNGGFQYYIVVIALFPFLMPKGNWYIKLMLLSGCVITYLILDFLYHDKEPLYELTFNQFLYFRITNIIFSFISLAVSGSYFSLAMHDTEDLLNSEKEKTNALLRNILPEETAHELKQEGKSTPRFYQNVTVMFTDFVDFTKKTKDMKPYELIHIINEYFSMFDELIEKYNIEKIKTIGDSYMCVAGLPQEDQLHAYHAICVAQEMMRGVEKIRRDREEKGLIFFDIRIGIHSGPVIAGIVGNKKFAFDIWGDTVNTASRVESNGLAGKINLTKDTKELTKCFFDFGSRGIIELKGKGEMELYYINDKQFDMHRINYEDARAYIIHRLRMELPEELAYHNAEHTLDVLNCAERIAIEEGLDAKSIMLIKTAALFHDSGFLISSNQHEEYSCEIARECLPKFNYSKQEIEQICGMILATKIPQRPKNILEMIVADADLDYLGRDDFFSIGNNLFKELSRRKVISNEKDWNLLQFNFLKTHRYHTTSSIKSRKSKKQKHLDFLNKIVNK